MGIFKVSATQTKIAHSNHVFLAEQLELLQMTLHTSFVLSKKIFSLNFSQSKTKIGRSDHVFVI
jgi:hypothetical protein